MPSYSILTGRPDGKPVGATKTVSIENTFVILAISFGLLLSLITAPFQAPDEAAHFLRIWQLSEGQLVADHYGGWLPVSLGDCFSQFDSLKFHAQRKTTLRAIANEFHRPLMPSRRQYLPFANTAIYSPVPYLPQLAMMLIGRLCSVPPIALMYMARCGNTLCYAAMGWGIIRMLPLLKWPTCMILLSPLPLFLAGSLSADPLSIEFTFLSTAAAIRLMADASLKPNRTIAVFAVSCVAAVLCKWTYGTVMLLVTVIPTSAWGTGRRRWFLPLMIVGCGLMAFGVWSYLAEPMHVPLRNGDPLPQLHWIRTHPINYLGVVLHTVHSDAKVLGITSIGVLGWLDTRLSPLFVLAYLVVVGWSVVNDTDGGIVTLLQRSVAFLAILLSVAAIFTCEYLVWNSTGSQTIEGIQGRYLLPLFLLAFFVMRLQGSRPIPPRVIQLMLLISCTYTVLAVALRYY